jgi:glycosyltransferase involved in cell wall biosynthesis
MMHLFLDASAASSGSGPTYIRNVLPHLARRDDVRATVLLSPELCREFQSTGNISVLEFKPAGGNAALRFWATQHLVPGLIAQSGADVLISAGNFALFRSPVPQILLSGNALYTSEDFFRDLRQRGHYGLWLDTKIKAWFAKKSVQMAGCTIAPSRAFADELERWTGVKVMAVHHGFDRDVFFRDESLLPSLAASLARAADELRLLFVSHYNYYRNFETLFRALAILKKQVPQSRFKLYLTCRLEGDANPGSYRPELAARLVEDLGIKDDVIQLGAVPYSQLHYVYQACDVYVTPAYVETFAHPLVEAMASGLPVVASDLKVHREVCGDAALYFPALSPEAMVKQIVVIAGSRERSTVLSRQGSKRAQDFSWQKHVETVVGLAALMLKTDGLSKELSG